MLLRWGTPGWGSPTLCLRGALRFSLFIQLLAPSQGDGALIDLLKKCTHKLKKVIAILRINRGVEITMSHFITRQSDLM